ncbi:hypothetical protein CKA32_005460 [Geitlerinema sp. FC II]|nr:hypothetical protein CKA32_005460 [Geitlerinema sp. FC II]
MYSLSVTSIAKISLHDRVFLCQRSHSFFTHSLNRMLI